ncbi:MAG: DUF2905 domain-containing protein [Coriobacteriia bacterium]|jgi:hypothetical protein|nr:DUF2905 domain-containing protein [Coriobacteriia bacterium]
MDLQNLGKTIATVGGALLALGLVLWAGGRLGLGSLPGDVRLTNENWGCYAPIASMILASIVLTIIVNVVLWLMKR